MERMIARYRITPQHATADGGFAHKPNREQGKKGLVNVVLNKVNGNMTKLVSSKRMETLLKKWRSGEAYTSVKVKRFFLFLADKAGHSWLNHLDVDKIDLGKGKQSIVKGGVYIPQYQIAVNKELGLKDRANVYRMVLSH